MSRQPSSTARVFSPQKGATPSHVDLLTGRLQRLAQVYETDYGVNVSEVSGSGAAGGLAGGLVRWAASSNLVLISSQMRWSVRCH